MQRRIQFRVLKPVVAEGVTIPPGNYAGIERSISVRLFGGLEKKSPSEYLMDVPEEVIAASLGEAPNPNRISMQVDVTEQVNSGEVKLG